MNYIQSLFSDIPQEDILSLFEFSIFSNNVLTESFSTGTFYNSTNSPFTATSKYSSSYGIGNISGQSCCSDSSNPQQGDDGVWYNPGDDNFGDDNLGDDSQGGGYQTGDDQRGDGRGNNSQGDDGRGDNGQGEDSADGSGYGTGNWPGNFYLPDHGNIFQRIGDFFNNLFNSGNTNSGGGGCASPNGCP